jgi:predicted Zn-dependent protease
VASDDSSTGEDRGTDSGAGEPGRPEGDVYDWYMRGLALLDSGDAAAAATLLQHAHAREPQSRSIRESLGRALLGAGDHAAAVAIFSQLASEDPADDFAHFGWGKAAMALGDLRVAREQFALATAMRPANPAYAAALRSARQAMQSS